MSPLPNKGLIICTSRSWETSLEKTHGTYSDRVRSIVQIFFFVLHSIGESAAFAPTCLLFSHILSGCKKKKKKSHKRACSAGKQRGLPTHAVQQIYSEGESRWRTATIWHTALKRFQAIVSSSTSTNAHGSRPPLIPGKSRAVYHS